MASASIKIIRPVQWQRMPRNSYAIRCSSDALLFVAGQIAARDRSGRVPEGMPYEQQFAHCFRNIVEIVKAAGGDARRIVMLRAFVLDMEEFHESAERIAPLWEQYLGKHVPAMTIVEVRRLSDPRALVELEAIAALDGRR